ncbi:MAG TPA: type VI secretion system baseplate subunit TssE [Rhodothermales bacterium]|nr:type VI secretion system baseplate subunit TssE [Rhodothermales bacterium]
MKAGLLDVLGDRFADGQRVSDVGEEYHVVLSIISNLNYLFNARTGSLMHVPDYGLPDITEIYRDIPDSVMKLQRAIKAAVEKYEPRLQRVRIEHQENHPSSMRLIFLLSGELQNREKVRFETTFSSNDPANVKPLRQLL